MLSLLAIKCGPYIYQGMMTRTCFRCHQTFDATPDNFHRERSRPLGLSYECKQCHKNRKKGRDRRKERWANLTPEQKAKVKERQKRYNQTDKGRAIFLRKAYQRVDACDLTTEEVQALIIQPCVYCGTTESPRGLDRIDNALPHIRGNVRPACAPCNFARGDRFSAEEMDIIGLAIRKVMEARKAQG
jgi:hypothetical protein